MYILFVEKSTFIHQFNLTSCLNIGILLTNHITEDTVFATKKGCSKISEGKRKTTEPAKAGSVVFQCVVNLTTTKTIPTIHKAEGNRKMTVSKRFIEQRAESLKRITSETGVQLLMNRSIQSERTLGVVKKVYDFRRFLTQGKRNVRTEILLTAMGYDIRKPRTKIQQNRTKTQLF